MLFRWLKDKGKIFKKVNEGCLLKKDRPSGKSEKHAKTQFLLHEKFLQQRKKGNKVSFKWLMLTGRKIAIENSHPTFTRWATQQFLRIYQVKIRRVQRKKQKPKSASEEALKQWHFNFREKVVKSKRNNENFDPKWGRFRPERRFNVDQVPLPFVMDCRTTYEVGKKDRFDKVWVSTPGSGLDKRQCTLQVLVSSEDNSHIRTDIIFRGKQNGRFIHPEEKKLYHPDVDVYFQANAWADLEFSLNWVEKTLKTAVQGSDDEFLLLCDNLGCQVHTSFKSAVQDANGFVWNVLKDATDLVQPVDAGYGQLFKEKIRQVFEDWLMEDENMDQWLGNKNQKPFTASQRRILIVNWVGRAQQLLFKSDYDGFRKNCFDRTGCNITADGSEDCLIKPEGLSNYKAWFTLFALDLD